VTESANIELTGMREFTRETMKSKVKNMLPTSASPLLTIIAPARKNLI
jgi:hypothetical protein